MSTQGTVDHSSTQIQHPPKVFQSVVSSKWLFELLNRLSLHPTNNGRKSKITNFYDSWLGGPKNGWDWPWTTFFGLRPPIGGCHTPKGDLRPKNVVHSQSYSFLGPPSQLSKKFVIFNFRFLYVGCEDSLLKELSSQFSTNFFFRMYNAICCWNCDRCLSRCKRYQGYKSWSVPWLDSSTLH